VKAEGEGQKKAEGRRQKAEGGRQRAKEGGGRRAEGRRQNIIKDEFFPFSFLIHPSTLLHPSSFILHPFFSSLPLYPLHQYFPKKYYSLFQFGQIWRASSERG
jgi:hypothetical protein